MKMIKQCPKCGCNEIHTETGVDIVRTFVNGKKIEETKQALPRRIFCKKCGLINNG